MEQIRAAARRVHHHITESTPVTASKDALIAGWDVAIQAIEGELREVAQTERSVTLPSGLSVTEVQRLAKDEKAFIENLVRPMPQEPAPAAAQGTTFHAWVEQRARKMQGVGAMPTLPGMEEYDEDLVVALDTANLKKFQSNFESSEWAARVPKAVEHPFNVSIAGRLIRGKIDAVYEDGDRLILVDWKTNSKADADPLQLSIYRVAWADEFGIDLNRISAAFYYAALNETVYADNLLSRDDIARLIS
jgi:DNA helicase-2/ATP-dependent DNA helicase PcrA